MKTGFTIIIDDGDVQIHELDGHRRPTQAEIQMACRYIYDRSKSEVLPGESVATRMRRRLEERS